MKISNEYSLIVPGESKPNIFENVKVYISNILGKIASKVVQVYEKFQNNKPISTEIKIPFSNISVVVEVKKEDNSHLLEIKEQETPEFRYFQCIFEKVMTNPNAYALHGTKFLWGRINYLFDQYPHSDGIKLRETFYDTLKFSLTQKRAETLNQILAKIFIEDEDIAFIERSENEFYELSAMAQFSSILVANRQIPFMFDLFSNESNIFKEKVVYQNRDLTSKILFGFLKHHKIGEFHGVVGNEFVVLRDFELQTLQNAAWEFVHIETATFTNSNIAIKNSLRKIAENSDLSFTSSKIVVNPNAFVEHTGFSLQ